MLYSTNMPVTNSVTVLKEELNNKWKKWYTCFTCCKRKRREHGEMAVFFFSLLKILVWYIKTDVLRTPEPIQYIYYERKINYTKIQDIRPSSLLKAATKLVNNNEKILKSSSFIQLLQQQSSYIWRPTELIKIKK